MKVLSIFAVFILVRREWCASADLFSAVYDLEYLLDTYEFTIEKYANYITHEEKRLKRLKRAYKLFKSEYDLAVSGDPEIYLGNPINAFKLIKMLSIDLERIQMEIEENARHVKEKTLAKNPELTYPTYEDLSGAARAMTRLQETYQLSVSESAEGKLNGVKYSNAMCSSDCYELGRALYHSQDYNHSIPWMMESLRKYEDTPSAYFTKLDIYEHIAISYYKAGDHKSAKDLTDRILKMDSRLFTACDQDEIWKTEVEMRRQRRQTEDLDWKNIRIYDNVHVAKEITEAYHALCRGEYEVPKHMSKWFTCRYQSEKHPFLKIAPLKEEQLYIKPDIYLYHDVIYDDEIQEIMETAGPQLERSKVVSPDPTDKNGLAAEYRISKNAWLQDHIELIAKKINPRLRDMTALDPTSGEFLQIANYGIGGHYEPHMDVALKRDDDQTQKRIASVLFYMSDVAQGGATVFLQLGLTVFPKKRAALFWHNLHPSGEADLATEHGACPVLRGSKWVSNKWIHAENQESVRPCSLQYEQEGFLYPLPKPIRKTAV